MDLREIAVFFFIFSSAVVFFQFVADSAGVVSYSPEAAPVSGQTVYLRGQRRQRQPYHQRCCSHDLHKMDAIFRTGFIVFFIRPLFFPRSPSFMPVG